MCWLKWVYFIVSCENSICKRGGCLWVMSLWAHTWEKLICHSHNQTLKYFYLQNCSSYPNRLFTDVIIPNWNQTCTNINSYSIPNNFMARYSISHLKINHIVANTQFTSSNTLSSVMFLPQIPEIKPTLCNNGISPQMEHVNWKVSPIWLQYGFTLQLAINRIFFGLSVFAISSIEPNLPDHLRSIYKPQNFNCCPNNRMGSGPSSFPKEQHSSYQYRLMLNLLFYVQITKQFMYIYVLFT